MSRAAQTVQAFGGYLIALGLALVVMPNLMLAAFTLPQTNEVWIRVVGVLVFNVGIYYIAAARCEARGFFVATVYARFGVLLAFTAFAMTGLAEPLLILFGLLDALGALWTARALRIDRAVPAE